MRMPYETESFARAADCRDLTDQRRLYEIEMYGGCIPERFWFIRQRDCTHNRYAFDNRIVPYSRELGKARRGGYNLLLNGDNGTGKTYFLSYLLGQAVRRGYSVYYTRLVQLDYDLKRGFDNKVAQTKLIENLNVDFLAIDELGKEHVRSAFLMSQLELLLKTRYDDGAPVLLASNLDYEEICESYGPTVGSMLEGYYLQTTLETGDYRKRLRAGMVEEMGMGA